MLEKLDWLSLNFHDLTENISADSNRKGWAGSSLIITQPWLQQDLNRTAKNPATSPNSHHLWDGHRPAESPVGSA